MKLNLEINFRNGVETVNSKHIRIVHAADCYNHSTVKDRAFRERSTSS